MQENQRNKYSVLYKRRCRALSDSKKKTVLCVESATARDMFSCDLLNKYCRRDSINKLLQMCVLNW